MSGNNTFTLALYRLLRTNGRVLDADDETINLVSKYAILIKTQSHIISYTYMLTAYRDHITVLLQVNIIKLCFGFH